MADDEQSDQPQQSDEEVFCLNCFLRNETQTYHFKKLQRSAESNNDAANAEQVMFMKILAVNLCGSKNTCYFNETSQMDTQNSNEHEQEDSMTNEQENNNDVPENHDHSAHDTVILHFI